MPGHVLYLNAEYYFIMQTTNAVPTLLAEHYRMPPSETIDIAMPSSSCSNAHVSENYAEALEYMEQCYQLDLQLGEAESISSSLNNLAALYLATDQPETAQQYILKAITIERKLDRPATLAIRLGMASDILNKLKEYDQALTFINEAYALDSMGGRIFNAAIRLSQKAEVLIALEKDAEATDCLQRALPVFHKKGNAHSEAVCCNQLGTLALNRGDIATAKNYYLRAEELAEGANSKLIRLNTARGLWRTERDRNKAAALGYLEECYTLSDSLFNDQSHRSMSNFSIRFDYGRKRHQIELQQKEIENQRNVQICLTLFFLFVAVVFCARPTAHYTSSS